MRFSPNNVCAGFILGLVGFAILSSPGANAAEETCRKTLGNKAAERLAWECLLTETSIHAPCNANATCPDIVSSIMFGCTALRDALIKDPGLAVVSKDNRHALHVPKFCAKYLGGP